MAVNADTLEGLKERLDELEAWRVSVEKTFYALNQDLHVSRKAHDGMVEAAGPGHGPQPMTVGAGVPIDEGEKGLPGR